MRSTADKYASTCLNIHSKVSALAIGLRVLVAKTRQHIGGIIARIVTQLPGNYFQCFGVRVDKYLPASSYVASLVPVAHTPPLSAFVCKRITAEWHKPMCRKMHHCECTLKYALWLNIRCDWLDESQLRTAIVGV